MWGTAEVHQRGKFGWSWHVGTPVATSYGHFSHWHVLGARQLISRGKIKGGRLKHTWVSTYGKDKSSRDQGSIRQPTYNYCWDWSLRLSNGLRTYYSPSLLNLWISKYAQICSWVLMQLGERVIICLLRAALYDQEFWVGNDGALQLACSSLVWCKGSTWRR
jgi:hypothetical protein